MKLPTSLPAAASRAAKTTMASYLQAPDSKSFDALFSGTKLVDDGIKRLSDAGFVKAVRKDFIDQGATDYQMASVHSYHGGMNASYVIGLIPSPSFDFDLESAYPTAMVLVPDVDFLHRGGCVGETIVDLSLDLGTFLRRFPLGAYTPLMAQVEFTFPRATYQPCIPVWRSGSIVFPLSSLGAGSCYATAPEILLALRMGARIRIVRGHVAHPLHRPDGSISHALAVAVKQLVVDRSKAAAAWGKKSLFAQALKVAVNSIYGKTAQDIAPSKSWNAFRQELEEIGGSSITSAHHAAMTTALVRCVLCAAIEQLHRLGYESYSVTTDGFITNAPDDVVESLDLFGFADDFRGSRKYLTNGDPSVWAVKHHQDSFLNFTTRGNVSLQEGGVVAGAGFHTGSPKETPEGRRELYHAVVTRSGRGVSNRIHEATGFKDMSRRDLGGRCDFRIRTQKRCLQLNPDFKREVVESSLADRPVVLDGVIHPFATFDTCPYATVGDFDLCRSVQKSRRHVIKTVDDVSDLLQRVQRKKETAESRDPGRNVGH